MLHKTFESDSAERTTSIGKMLGSCLQGGEVIELVSDLGGGKTTFVRGLAEGFGSDDAVASPSFTISYVYGRADGKALHHFDFYRLDDPGIVANELAEVVEDPECVVAVEWGEIVHDVLPKNHIVVSLVATQETKRNITINYPTRYEQAFGKITGEL
jgi:tRNA threonylcarbamoyladenosine biosynthesis protein TsaE